MADPLIVETAINGGMTKDANPHIPLSADEVIASCTACFEAGAQIIHAHAGDAFVGTFLHCLLQGRDAIEATRWGVVAAGLTTGSRGAILNQPAPDEVQRYLGTVRVQRV